MRRMLKKNIDAEVNKQTIVEHLDDLRKRLIYSILWLVGFTILSYNYSDVVVRDMVNKAPNMNFVFIAPAELFMAYIKIALICAVALSLPFILYNVWMFLSPGLEKNEKRVILIALFSGGILFILGALFGYMVTLPLSLRFFGEFSIDEVQAMISFNNYLSFASTLVLAFGIVFELPILMVLLVQFNIIKTSLLKKSRKVMVLVIFTLAAILTPPDVVSQTLLAIPMLILYEIGIFFSNIAEKRKLKKSQD